MLKLLGILLISGSVSAYGAYMSHRVKCRILIRNEFIDFLKYVESSIRYGGSALERIYSVFSSPMLDKYGFTYALRSQSNVSSIVDSLYLLSDMEQRKAYEFLESIGKSHYREKETELCAKYIEFFSERAKSTGKQDETRALLYKKLGLIAALLAAVIFI